MAEASLRYNFFSFFYLHTMNHYTILYTNARRLRKQKRHMTDWTTSRTLCFSLDLLQTAHVHVSCSITADLRYAFELNFIFIVLKWLPNSCKFSLQIQTQSFLQYICFVFVYGFSPFFLRTHRWLPFGLAELSAVDDSFCTVLSFLMFFS